MTTTKWLRPLPTPTAPAPVRSVAGRFVPHRLRQVIASARGRVRLRPWDPGFDFRPPPCPAGMVTAPPDFVGIGAMRSGTGWWFSQLNRHPQVHAAAGHKELHFLTRFTASEPTPEDVADYARWFPRPPGAIAGEWTPYYMLHVWTGALLARMAPDAKVLVILRDPVERYCSGIALDRKSPRVNHATESSHFFRGLYGAHLSRVAPYLRDGSLLVLQYERCLVERDQQLARTFRFLGVDPVEIGGPGPRVGRPVEPYRISAERRSILIDAYRPDVELLAANHPEIDVSLWKNFT